MKSWGKSKTTAMSSHRFALSSQRFVSRLSIRLVAGARKTSSTALLTQYSRGTFGSWLGVLPTSLFVNRLQPARSENPSRIARVSASTPSARSAMPCSKRIQRTALEYWNPWRSAASDRYARRHPTCLAISATRCRYPQSPPPSPDPRPYSASAGTSSPSPEGSKPRMPRTFWNATMCSPRFATAGAGHAFQKNLILVEAGPTPPWHSSNR